MPTSEEVPLASSSLVENDFDWLENPISSFSQNLLEEFKASGLCVDEFAERLRSRGNVSNRFLFSFEERIREGLRINPHLLESIPLLNVIPTQYQKEGMLVRYRGMVQDMFESEVYFPLVCRVQNETGVEEPCLSKYLDVLHFDNEYTYRMEPHDPAVVAGIRSVYYCLPLPGASSWIAEQMSMDNAKNLFDCPSYEHLDRAQPSASFSSRPSRKRFHNDLDDACSDGMNVDDDNGQVSGFASSSTPEFDEFSRSNGEDAGDLRKRSKSNIPESVVESSNSFPQFLPCPSDVRESYHGTERALGKPCIVKLYDTVDDSDDALRICDYVEFVGILSIDAESDFQFDTFAREFQYLPEFPDQVVACHPPRAFVPRLHVLSHHRLPSMFPSDFFSDTLCQHPSWIEGVRADLIDFLTRVLWGDSLSAQYFLLFLLGHVFDRPRGHVVGALPVSFGLLSPGDELVFRELLELLSPAHLQFDLRISSLSTSSINPQKRTDTNRIEPTIAQVVSGTALLINQLALESGQLDSQAVRNIDTLRRIVSQQEVEYMYGFGSSFHHVDIRILSTTDGVTSILEIPTSVPVVKNSPDPLDLSSVDLSKVESWRKYLGWMMRNGRTFVVSAAAAEHIQGRYADLRRSESDINLEMLHCWMNGARLLALSRGCTELLKEHFDLFLEMEFDRRCRCHRRSS